LRRRGRNTVALSQRRRLTGVAINGERARVLMREVVCAASDAIPDGVELEIVGRGRWWVLRKVDPANPAGKVVAHTVLNDG
jgi:predicted type IV restriction endonuclease